MLPIAVPADVSGKYWDWNGGAVSDAEQKPRKSATGKDYGANP